MAGEGMKRILEFFGTLFGSVLGIGVMALMALSLPLNVLVIMRWWGWEWWSALLGATFMSAVPVVGQIAYFVFTFFGAYYFINAGFDWRSAVSPVPEIISLSDMTPEKFDEYKRTVIAPIIERKCLSDATKELKTS